MALTVDELYNAARPLPLSEKLQVARRLLTDIPPESVVDHSDTWSDIDIHEATQHSLRNAEASLGEESSDG